MKTETIPIPQILFKQFTGFGIYSIISSLGAAASIWGAFLVLRDFFAGSAIDIVSLIILGIGLVTFLSLFVFAAILVKKREDFHYHMWRTYYMAFGAPSASRLDRKDEIRHIKNRLKIKWYSNSSIPKTVRFIGEGGSISVRDLESFMDFLVSHLRQLSNKTAIHYGYVLNLKELDRGIVSVTMEPADEGFKKKEAEWQFIRLFKSEVTYSFTDFGSIVQEFDSNNRMSFRVRAKESYRETTLLNFEAALEAFFDTSFTVEQRRDEIYVVEVDRDEKLETIESVRYVARAWTEAAKRAKADFFMRPNVRIHKESSRMVFEVSFDRDENIDEQTFNEIRGRLGHYLSQKFGGKWQIENNLMESGRVLLKQYNDLGQNADRSGNREDY